MSSSDIKDLIGRLTNQNNESQRTGCKKCGYSGHLTFQCRNFVRVDPKKDVVVDVSSTSSEEEDSDKEISVSSTTTPTSSDSDSKRKKYQRRKTVKERSQSLERALKQRDVPRQRAASYSPPALKRAKRSHSVTTDETDKSDDDSDSHKRKRKKISKHQKKEQPRSKHRKSHKHKEKKKSRRKKSRKRHKATSESE